MSRFCGRGGASGGWLWAKVLASSPWGGVGVVEGLMAKVKTGKCSTLFFFFGCKTFYTSQNCIFSAQLKTFLVLPGFYVMPNT